LVGSVPLNNSDEVFELVGPILKEFCSRYPDGETGERKNWIGWQFAVFRDQDALVQTDKRERDYQLYPPFNFVPGKEPEDLDFSDLGFAREAVQSYSKFVDHQEKGTVAQSAKFLVALPTPFAPVYSFTAYEVQEEILPVYEAAMLREIDQLAAAIPHDKLAIQWDVATEISIFEQVYPATFTSPWEILIEKLASLGNYITEAIEMGYHLCYGSMNNRHWKEPNDLGMCVSVANAVSLQMMRRIDFVHMPVPMNRVDDAYYAPLGHLILPPETEIVLGLVHDGQNLKDNLGRVDAAKAHLNDFGISTECGLGRRDRANMPGLMNLLGELAKRL